MNGSQFDGIGKQWWKYPAVFFGKMFNILNNFSIGFGNIP